MVLIRVYQRNNLGKISWLRVLCCLWDCPYRPDPLHRCRTDGKANICLLKFVTKFKINVQLNVVNYFQKISLLDRSV